MTKEELKTLLDNSTAIERDVLDRMASGYSKGVSSTAQRLSRDTGIQYALVLDTLGKFRELGLVDWNSAQG